MLYSRNTVERTRREDTSISNRQAHAESTGLREDKKGRRDTLNWPATADRCGRNAARRKAAQGQKSGEDSSTRESWSLVRTSAEDTDVYSDRSRPEQHVQAIPRPQNEGGHPQKPFLSPDCSAAHGFFTILGIVILTESILFRQPLRSPCFLHYSGSC